MNIGGEGGLKKNFVDAPRPGEKPAKRKSKPPHNEHKLRKAPYEIFFDYADKTSFYETRCRLPAAAHWNMDEFLLVYLATGIEALLAGPTDWNWSVDGSKTNTRKQLKKAAKLCRKQIKHNLSNNLNYLTAGDEAFRIIADIGVSRLWD